MNIPLKRLIIVSAAAMMIGIGVLAYSPYHRHNRQAAEFTRDLGNSLTADGEMRVVEDGHRVDNLGAAGGYCYFVADLTFSTFLPFSAAEKKIDALLDQDLDGYRMPSITDEGHREGRNIVRLVVSRVGEGGSMDLRCG